MRVFIGLAEIAGRNRALKQGFQELGHKATLIDLWSERFRYGNDDSLLLARAIRRLGSIRRRLPDGIIRWLLGVPEFVLRLKLFLWMLVSHDLFIYSFASSFFRYWDYRLIRFFGKTLICQFHGSDSRPPYLNGAYVSRPGYSTAACALETAALKARLRAVDRYANAIIDIPPQGYLHERSYYQRHFVGLPSGPFEAPREQPSMSAGENRPTRPVRILHAPKNAPHKGSAEIREMIRNLEAKGFAIEFVELPETTHREVIAEIQKADLVVDQLYCDYALNALPTEAMWWGKPVLSGGYSADLWARLVPAEILGPVVYVHPSDFEGRLEQLVVDADLRLRLGNLGHDFVRRHHHPRTVASNYLRVAAGEAPAEWLYDPRQMTDVWGGFFMSEERARKTTRDLIHEFGRSSLMLSDKPEVEEAIVTWALRE